MTTDELYLWLAWGLVWIGLPCGYLTIFITFPALVVFGVLLIAYRVYALMQSLSSGHHFPDTISESRRVF